MTTRAPVAYGLLLKTDSNNALHSDAVNRARLASA